MRALHPMHGLVESWHDFPYHCQPLCGKAARDSLEIPMPVKSDAPRAWQRMLSGRRLDLLDPSPLDIEIEDIAHGLARVARWNGQTIGDHPFSVASIA